MNQDLWTAVDGYFEATQAPRDETLEQALRASDAADMPPYHVTPLQGKFLHLMARIRGARCILEIGTLAGYSTIWMARALPAGGHLVTIESERKHADVAAANLARAGVAQLVDLRVGKALDVLPLLEKEAGEPFDLTFIDADKQNNANYFAWALSLSRPGGIIIVDNVVRGGAVADLRSTDPTVQGVHRLTDLIAAEPRVTASTIQTLGAKGYDGFTIALVND